MSGGQVLLFRAGGMRLGVFLADVGRLLVEGALIAVPFAHPAMAGLFVADDDGPVPVFDLRGLTEGAAVPLWEQSLGATVALFPTAKGPVGLRLEALLGTIATYEPLDEADTHALQQSAAPALRRTLTGAARTADGPFSFFSPEAFLAHLGL